MVSLGQHVVEEKIPMKDLALYLDEFSVQYGKSFSMTNVFCVVWIGCCSFYKFSSFLSLHPSGGLYIRQ